MCLTSCQRPGLLRPGFQAHLFLVTLSTAFSSGHSDQQHCPDMDVLERPVWAQAAIEPQALILLPS